jgi:hypothetical protein
MLRRARRGDLAMSRQLSILLALGLALLSAAADCSAQDPASGPASRPRRRPPAGDRITIRPDPDDAPASRTAARRRAADYLPLAPGREWRYLVKGPSPHTAERLETCTLRVETEGEGVVHEVRLQEGASGYAYRGYRADGLYEWRNAYLGGLRGVDRRSPPVPILLDPIEPGRTWSREDELSVQTSEVSDADETESRPAVEPQREADPTWRYVSTWTIEAVDETVVVPAGEFSCVRVVRIDVGGHWRTERRSWFAPGVGLVRETLLSRWNQDETRSSASLISHRAPELASRPRTADEVASTLALLPAFAARGGRPHVERLRRPELEETLRAAFFVVTTADGERRAVYYATPVANDGGRVRGGTLGPLSPTEAGGFSALLAGDVFRLRKGFEGMDDAAALARIVAVILGASRGPEFERVALPDGSQEKTSLDARGEIEASVAVRGRRRDGASYYAVVRVTVAEGALRTLSVKDGL